MRKNEFNENHGIVFFITNRLYTKCTVHSYVMDLKCPNSLTRGKQSSAGSLNVKTQLQLSFPSRITYEYLIINLDVMFYNVFTECVTIIGDLLALNQEYLYSLLGVLALNQGTQIR